MEDDLNYLKIEDDFNLFENGKQPYLFVNRRFKKNIKKIMQPVTSKLRQCSLGLVDLSNPI
jgi:hypothetical protein